MRVIYSGFSGCHGIRGESVKWRRHSRAGRMLVLYLVLAGVLLPSSAGADLEPRFLAPAPVGLNSGLVGYSYSVGNVMLDDALPLEGTESRLNALTAGYARTVDILGQLGRIWVAVPLANGKWTGDVEGSDSSTTRNGLGDPIIGVVWHLYGAPALSMSEFASYRPKTIVGLSIKARLPLGQYSSSQFFNLGTGRFQISPRIGLTHYIGKFILEAYASAWFFTRNDDFYRGNSIEQDAMVAFQVHAAYRFRRGWWGAVSFGQSFGGETRLNGVRQDNSQTNNRVGVTFAFPLARTHALKIVLTSGISTRAGADFNTVAIAWQHRWGAG